MSEKKFDIYFEFNYSGLNLAAFNKISGKLEYYKEQTYESYFKNYKELNFEKLEKILEESILEIEKSTKEFVRDIYLIIETPQSKSLKLSVTKNNEGNKVIKEDAVQDKTVDENEVVLENKNHIIIKAPMIGTFYRKPAPDKDVFTDVGKSVAEGDVLCVIEAMKLFNEIESEVSGKIVKILVDDQSPVEFDQPLFIIDPS